MSAGLWASKKIILVHMCHDLLKTGTVNAPNFEHVPYFEHHVNRGFSKPTTYLL